MIDILASDNGEVCRDSAIRDRSQTNNPKTDSWVKRDSDAARCMDQKTSNNKPFKDVRKEK
jgi:hypothetical protein